MTNVFSSHLKLKSLLFPARRHHSEILHQTDLELTGFLACQWATENFWSDKILLLRLLWIGLLVMAQNHLFIQILSPRKRPKCESEVRFATLKNQTTQTRYPPHAYSPKPTSQSILNQSRRRKSQYRSQDPPMRWLLRKLMIVWGGRHREISKAYLRRIALHLPQAKKTVCKRKFELYKIRI